ncbi:hypothetical protein EZV62_024631 [Acer yangbiense]|uniref:Uncharacterized protein n=1 Tax=Acer yangbiense TaxID=1000413 RepID=A0A5C7GXE6_9ROSI|nr:hypothetical protein EZV62_024631 [Acer yangbiense]
MRLGRRNSSSRKSMTRLSAGSPVQDFSEAGAVMAFIQGLQKGNLSWSLSKKGPTTYQELIERGEKYATTEDISDSKSHVTSAEPCETPKRWGRQARDKGKETQVSRQVNTRITARNSRFPPRDKFDEYTPPKVEELVQNGKLQDCVKSQESSDKATKALQHPSHQNPGGAQDLDDEEPINFIDTVPAIGDPRSTSSSKASASICLTTTSEDAPKNWDPISFSTEDSRGAR